MTGDMKLKTIMIHASFLTFVVATSLVAAAPGNISDVEWFEIESANEIYAEIIGKSWEVFKANHNKQYDSTGEEEYRRSVFAENMKKIEIHNQKYKTGEKSYWLGINYFADLKAEEFKALYTGCLKMRVNVTEGRSTFLPPNNVMLPTTVDWRQKGFVTPVKDQGQCGACWSFSTTGALEGQHFRKTGKLLILSEQQLVDCSTNFGNQGCQGGRMDQGFEYIEKYGIETGMEYPYKAKDDSCKYSASKIVAKDTGFMNIESGSESALQEAVATIGPISVAIDSSHSSFQLYSGGVYDEEQCSSTLLDHAVLAVGYGTDGGKNYWLVKNSWGKSWGDNGYIKIVRNKGNRCGIATQSSYPLM